MIDFFNMESDRFSKAYGSLPKKERADLVDDFIITDATKISWSRGLKQDLSKNRPLSFEASALTQGLYRPFTKRWLYFNRQLNEMVLLMPRFFPNSASENIVIGVSASESRSAFSVFITNAVPSLHAVDMVGSQFFPLYLYSDPEEQADRAIQHPDMFAAPQAPKTAKRRDAITDEGLKYFQAAYPSESITKEDLFFYVYGLLHSPEYRERYADNLGKELPRLPRVKAAADFWAFSKAGRTLADLHLYYDTDKVPMYAGVKIEHGDKPLTAADYRVEKMRWPKKGRDKDLTTIHYNGRITVTGIPAEAYEYVVNGKPAIEWVAERQGVKADKDSGIVSDANDWAVETMNNPRYPLELLLRVVTVSLETIKTVKGLPALGEFAA